MKNDSSWVRVTKVLQRGYLDEMRKVMEFYHFESESQAFDFCARRGLEVVRAQMEQTRMMRGITPEAMAKAMKDLEGIDE